MKRKALLGEFTAKSVLSDGQLAASLEEEKTKSGSTTATLPSCKLLQLCSHNRNLMEKILATQCKDFTRFAVLQLVKARGESFEI